MTHLPFSANKSFAEITAVIIVVSAIILAVTSVWNDAPIVDEIPHIGAGYSYITRGDYRLNPEHPPLAKDLAGVSLKIYGIQDQAAFADKSWQTDINGQWEFGRKLIFNSSNNAMVVSRFAKMPMLIFFIISTIIIFAWAKQISGYLTALMALFLFAFSPTVLAHSRFVTTDIPALFGVLLSSYFFVHYLKNQNKKTLAIAGLAFGIAELTKFSLFLLVPFFLTIAVLYALLESPGSKFKSIFYALRSTFCIILIGYIFVIWPVYVLHTRNYPPNLQHDHTQNLLGSYGNRSIAETVIYLSDKPIIRGLAEYGLGLLMVTQRSIGGNTTYFMGEVRNWAWPQYFPVVYFIKEPLAFWGLLALVLLTIVKQFKILNLKFKNIANWSRNNFDKLFMLAWIGLYWFVSIRANLNIGVRHLMPVYGFTFILLSDALVKICNSLSSKKLLTTYYLLLTTLFGWYLYENLSIYPYYLTYFNQIVLLRPSWAPAGQAGYIPGGHHYVVDSNLDWGQDLKRLADWVEKNNVKKISLDYFGWSDQSYYLKDNFVWISAGRYKNTDDFLKENPEGGYLAVSASYYMGSREIRQLADGTSYAWLDDYKPVTVIGNSIFVWYIPSTKY